MEIPPWWLAVSGLFFLLNTVLFVVLILAGIQFMKFMRDVAPRVAALEKSIQALITEVQGVAKRVDEVAISVKQTVDNVGGKAKSVVGSAELVASTATRQFEKYSPVISGVITAIKVIKAVQDLRATRSDKKRESQGNSKKSSKIAVYKK